jgi:zinc protease
MRVRRLGVALCATGLVACLGAGGERPAWEVPPEIGREAPVVSEGHLQRSELDNGVQVLLLEDRRLPRVTVGVTVRRGEASVAPAHAGLADFTAELMERGAGDRDALALAQAVDELGAILSVSASWDEMTVEVSGLSRDLDRLLEILSDVALRPRFDPGEADKTRSESLAALERSRDEPGTVAHRSLAKLLYPGHRFGLPASGTPETVAGFDAALARDFYARVWVPGDAIFFGVGDLDAPALEQRAGARFGAWTGGEPISPGPAPPDPAPAARAVVVVDRPDLEQSRIVLGHEGISRTDPRRIAAALLNTAVGGGAFSSRLTESIRVDAGLTYGVYSALAMRRQPGPFLVSTSTRVPETRRVIDLILAGLERARSDPPRGEELDATRRLLVGGFSLGLETSDAVMGALVDLAVYGLPDDSLDTYRDRVRGTSAEEVAAIARSLLHPERAAIVVVGPAEVLVPQLQGLGPIDVIAP